MRVIAVYPGRFHPFHKGHASSFKQLAEKFGLKNTYLALSAKQEPPKSPFSVGDRAKMAMLLGIPKENIIITNQPYKAEEYIKRMEEKGIDPNSVMLVFGVSKKDMEGDPSMNIPPDPRFRFQPKKDGSPSYLQPYNDKANAPMTKHAYVFSTDVGEFTIMGKKVRDASKIRSMYAKADEKSKMRILTDLYGKPAKLIKPVFDDNIQLTENHSKQQLSLYNPFGNTYRGKKMPTLDDPSDIYNRSKQYDIDDMPDEPVDEPHIDSSIKELIKNNLDKLSHKEKQLLKLRYWHDMTLDDIADRLDVNAERIRQIEAKALSKLRLRLNRDNPEAAEYVLESVDYLDEK